MVLMLLLLVAVVGTMHAREWMVATTDDSISFIILTRPSLYHPSPNGTFFSLRHRMTRICHSGRMDYYYQIHGCIGYRVSAPKESTIKWHQSLQSSVARMCGERDVIDNQYHGGCCNKFFQLNTKQYFATSDTTSNEQSNSACPHDRRNGHWCICRRIKNDKMTVTMM
jgi:hypothetical protein